MIVGDPPDHVKEAADLILRLRRLTLQHGLRDATICGVPMAAFAPKVPPVTRRESMAACLLAAYEGDITWKIALDRLRADQRASQELFRFWRMADFAIEHIPYLSRLPDGDAT